MKTTVEIDDQLLRAAKKAAIDRKTTLRELITSGLCRELAAEPKATQGSQWITASGHFPIDLDLSNRDKLYAWLDAHPEDEAGE